MVDKRRRTTECDARAGDSPVKSAPPGIESRARLLNVPNTLCAIRLIGSFVLVGLALADNGTVFFPLLLFLLMTDWVDGKLAILLDQRTTFGARLDSVADACLYTALLFGAVWLKGDVLRAELPWLAVATVSYAITSGMGLVKFGRWPSYHTRAAKTSWLLVTIAAISLFAGWSLWPLRIAAAGVVLTNLEATVMTLVLPQWQADVPSLYHAWRQRHQS